MNLADTEGSNKFIAGNWPMHLSTSTREIEKEPRLRETTSPAGCPTLAKDKSLSVQFLIQFRIKAGIINVMLGVRRLLKLSVGDGGRWIKHTISPNFVAMSLFWGYLPDGCPHIYRVLLANSLLSRRQISSGICFSLSRYTGNFELPKDVENYYNQGERTVLSVINDLYT